MQLETTNNHLLLTDFMINLRTWVFLAPAKILLLLLVVLFAILYSHSTFCGYNFMENCLFYNTYYMAFV